MLVRLPDANFGRPAERTCHDACVICSTTQSPSLTGEQCESSGDEKDSLAEQQYLRHAGGDGHSQIEID
jgi:hypothetical protein